MIELYTKESLKKSCYTVSCDFEDNFLPVLQNDCGIYGLKMIACELVIGFENVFRPMVVLYAVSLPLSSITKGRNRGVALL